MITNDFKLLEVMINDSENQSDLYHPGEYWIKKSKSAINEIKKYGLENFRGSDNTIGLSYADNIFIDVRNTYNDGLKTLLRKTTDIYPLSHIFASQVNLTESYAKTNILYSQEIINLKERTKYLLKKYKVPYSLLGGCLSKVNINENEYSIHYLNLLDQHDNIAKHIDFSKVRTVFEIGGGFGANIHLLLENYPNIKKVLYLDIPPNLYVGTQYLKAFYDNTVFDYRILRNSVSLKFSKYDNLEIYCIAPWQIENFVGKIDLFMNSNSFVEMTPSIVKNYVEKFEGTEDSINSEVALTTYDNFDNTTINPKELPKFFKEREFKYFENETLLNSSRKNLYFISSNKSINKL